MKRIVFGMLNPSKAGWPGGDLTITKVCGFSLRAFGFYPSDELEVVDGGAIFSDDRLYRYRLWRVLGRRAAAGGPITAVRVDVVNMFPLVSTDPKGLYASVNPGGEGIDGTQLCAVNRRHVEEACAGADMLIAAWGGIPAKPLWMPRTAEALLTTMSCFGDVLCLGQTKGCDPLHPSRLPYAAALELYRPRRTAAFTETGRVVA